MNRDKMKELYESEPNKFNGGYIIAIRKKYEISDILSALNITASPTFEFNSLYWYVENNQLKNANIEYILNRGYKQFYINNGVLSWEEPTSANNAQVEQICDNPDVNSKFSSKFTDKEVFDKFHSSEESTDSLKEEQILKLQLQNQRLEKENKQLKNLCKNIQGAVELEMKKICYSKRIQNLKPY